MFLSIHVIGIIGSGRLPQQELAIPMTAGYKQASGESKTCRETEPYAVVIATKREGIDIVLRGLSADQAEQISTQKNREYSSESSIHALPERELR
jgi:hypothetical protein